MKLSSIFLQLVQVGIRFVLCVVSTSIACAEQATSAGPQAEVPSSAPEHPAGENPGCPSPVVPEQALFLGQYANLELTITANRDGSLQKVVVSKKSKARIYDEYTRTWVERHWKMPVAKPSEPDVRTFTAPIVYPKAKWPSGGRYPPPGYPDAFIRDRIEGLVIIEIKVAESGEVESARTVLSSGHKGLDAHTQKWVSKRWKLPPGEKRCFHVPIAYLLK